MALIPEFISVLKDIRDRMYPIIESVYNEMFGLVNARITTPTVNVPNNQDGSAGEGSVVYDKATGEFTFNLPIGAKGKDLGITYAVTTIAERNALTGMSVGEIAFVDDTGMVYTYLDSLVWGTGVLFTPTTQWTGLSDTPSSYTGNQNKFVQCRTDELGVQFISKDDALVNELARITANENAITTKAPLLSPILTGTPTAPTATEGTNTTQIASTAFVKAKSEKDSIGVGQTMQDVRIERAHNVEYTNNTGKPIIAYISAFEQSTLNAQMYGYVDDIVVTKCKVSDAQGSLINTISLTIPNGSTYRVTIIGSSPYIGTWVELR